MARGITEKDVLSACDALLLAGERPTIERVRQKIGRGSPNTVSPMLDAWFKGLGRRLQDPGAFSPPPDVPSPVLQAAQHFWEVAQAESRRDVEAQISAGLASAQAQVDEAHQHAAIVDAAAAEAAARTVGTEAELERVRASLDSERLNHRGAATQLEGALQRSTALEAEVIQLRQSVVDERARADRAIAAADERSNGAERRAAMEIEGERMSRIRAEKLAESTAKKFEAALRQQIAATEQMNAAEDRLTAFRVQANQREQAIQGTLKSREAHLDDLEAALAETKLALARATGQDVLVEQIVAKLAAGAVERHYDAGAGPGTRPSRKKRTSA
jgi:hypothetical protein